jgi:hypothetical protein
VENVARVRIVVEVSRERVYGDGFRKGFVYKRSGL